MSFRPMNINFAFNTTNHTAFFVIESDKSDKVSAVLALNSADDTLEAGTLKNAAEKTALGLSEKFEGLFVPIGEDLSAGTLSSNTKPPIALSETYEKIQKVAKDKLHFEKGIPLNDAIQTNLLKGDNFFIYNPTGQLHADLEQHFNSSKPSVDGEDEDSLSHDEADSTTPLASSSTTSSTAKLATSRLSTSTTTTTTQTTAPQPPVLPKHIKYRFDRLQQCSYFLLETENQQQTKEIFEKEGFYARFPTDGDPAAWSLNDKQFKANNVLIRLPGNSELKTELEKVQQAAVVAYSGQRIPVHTSFQASIEPKKPLAPTPSAPAPAPAPASPTKTPSAAPFTNVVSQPTYSVITPFSLRPSSPPQSPRSALDTGSTTLSTSTIVTSTTTTTTTSNATTTPTVTHSMTPYSTTTVTTAPWNNMPSSSAYSTTTSVTSPTTSAPPTKVAVINQSDLLLELAEELKKAHHPRKIVSFDQDPRFQLFKKLAPKNQTKAYELLNMLDAAKKSKASSVNDIGLILFIQNPLNLMAEVVYEGVRAPILNHLIMIQGNGSAKMPPAPKEKEPASSSSKSTSIQQEKRTLTNSEYGNLRALNDTLVPTNPTKDKTTLKIQNGLVADLFNALEAVVQKRAYKFICQYNGVNSFTNNDQMEALKAFAKNPRILLEKIRVNGHNDTMIGHLLYEFDPKKQ